MIIGIFLRHIKTYKGINFIPISDSSSFCGLVGENGVGKSTILESLDTFFHHKDWNINIEHVAKTDANTPYIIPIFLIEKKKLKLNPEEIIYVEKIDKALRSNDPSGLPKKTRDIGVRALEHIQNVLQNLENSDEYYIIAIGINKDNTKSFGLFKKTITSNFNITDFIKDSSQEKIIEEGLNNEAEEDLNDEIEEDLDDEIQEDLDDEIEEDLDDEVEEETRQSKT